jgi:hypothetical protein
MHVPQDSMWREILKTFWFSGWTKQGLALPPFISPYHSLESGDPVQPRALLSAGQTARGTRACVGARPQAHSARWLGCPIGWEARAGRRRPWGPAHRPCRRLRPHLGPAWPLGAAPALGGGGAVVGSCFRSAPARVRGRGDPSDAHYHRPDANHRPSMTDTFRSALFLAKPFCTRASCRHRRSPEHPPNRGNSLSGLQGIVTEKEGIQSSGSVLFRCVYRDRGYSLECLELFLHWPCF